MKRRKFLQLAGGAAATAVGLAAGLKPEPAWGSCGELAVGPNDTFISVSTGPHYDMAFYKTKFYNPVTGGIASYREMIESIHNAKEWIPMKVQYVDITGSSPFAASHTLTEGNGPSRI